MAKLEIYHQQSMDAKVVPPAKEDPVFNSFAEMFESEEVDMEWKLKWIGQVITFETFNAITKRDLQAALKWLFKRTHQGRRKNW